MARVVLLAVLLLSPTVRLVPAAAFGGSEARLLELVGAFRAMADADISRRIESRLAQEASFGKVRVRTDGGVVNLTGDVSGIGASARASEIAREMPGVRTVNNALVPGAADNTPAVTTMQRALKQRGFDPGPIDGVIGLRTQAALRAYQQAHHLKITGRLDQDTARRLGASAEK